MIDVEAYVRQNARSAAITAALLILFGFFFFTGASGSRLFLTAHTIFLFALRFGGILMVAVVVWSCVGVPSALFADAVSSWLIGTGLVVSALLMMAAAGVSLNPLIYTLCGVTFVISGLRSWRDYRTMPKTVPLVHDGALDTFLGGQDQKDVDPEAGQADRASQPRGVGGTSTSLADAEPIVFERPQPKLSRRPGGVLSDSDDEEPAIRLGDVSSTPPESTPQGFLADFAKEEEDQPPKE